jgi:hypothetical protein
MLPGGQGAAVPPGQLILLGDNPAHSTDSRHCGYLRAGILTHHDMFLAFATAVRVSTDAAKRRCPAGW